MDVVTTCSLVVVTCSAWTWYRATMNLDDIARARRSHQLEALFDHAIFTAAALRLGRLFAATSDAARAELRRAVYAGSDVPGLEAIRESKAQQDVAAGLLEAIPDGVDSDSKADAMARHVRRSYLKTLTDSESTLLLAAAEHDVVRTFFADVPSAWLDALIASETAERDAFLASLEDAERERWRVIFAAADAAANVEAWARS